MTRQVTLSVNDTLIDTDYFVQGFIDHTFGGMLEALEGTGKMGVCDLSIDGDKVKLNLNNAPVSMNPFVTKIVRGTVLGMVSSLKGVNKINRLYITVKR